MLLSSRSERFDCLLKTEHLVECTERHTNTHNAHALAQDLTGNDV